MTVQINTLNSEKDGISVDCERCRRVLWSKDKLNEGLLAIAQAKAAWHGHEVIITVYQAPKKTKGKLIST